MFDHCKIHILYCHHLSSDPLGALQCSQKYHPWVLRAGYGGAWADCPSLMTSPPKGTSLPQNCESGLPVSSPRGSSHPFSPHEFLLSH
jgi:hypothetical protein